MAQVIPILLTRFWGDFLFWVQGLTLTGFLLIYWPLLVLDFTRAIGKTVFLLFHITVRTLSGKGEEEDSDFNPWITLMIPAHNEEEIIIRAIETALETNYPNKEVLVIDDGSTDDTYSLARPYQQKELIKLIHRETASGSKAGALNYGILFASGDIIISVDADTMIERNSLKELVKPMRNPEVEAVAGNVRIFGGEHGGDNLIVKLQQYEYLVNMELGRRFSSLIGTLLIISGAFGAFWKEHVVSLGGYDPDTITEDFDITFKVKKLKKNIVFGHKAIAWTFAPETWRDWKRQRVRWTRGQAETLWKHRNVFSGSGFGLVYVVSVYDMVFMDIGVLFTRTVWMLVLILQYADTLPYVALLMFIIYYLMELFSVFAANLLSPRKEKLNFLFLALVMVFIYRPYYSLIRLKAYLDWALKQEKKW
ncbi:MAG: glycosyltransferase [Candidatus Bathyarchaeota archaeon]|nr:glycosyltransferase [Candidatus Bathyarchaeota archaeon]